MLTPEQQAHYDTFGFLLLPSVFPAHEMADIIESAEAIWSADETQLPNEEVRVTYFFERSPHLTRLVTDDRIYPVITQLVGKDPIWVGSEGNISNRQRVNWHSDRKYYREGEGHWIDYPQIKLMIYLQGLTRDTGCLRVIPGSHRMPYHDELGDQETNGDSNPFGVDGPDLPAAALEVEPGDVILFNHCCWHAAYGGADNRRYIAMKFAARPDDRDQLVSLKRYTPRIFQPHDVFLRHENRRIRRLVEALPLYASGHLLKRRGATLSN